MILTSLAVDRASFAHRTGWELKPEGACRGDICVPLPADAADAADASAAPAPSAIDARVLSERLGMPLLHDDEHGVWALGPATAAGHALATAEFPAISLPDIRTGEPFELTSLRGQKVLVLAWASW